MSVLVIDPPLIVKSSLTLAFVIESPFQVPSDIFPTLVMARVFIPSGVISKYVFISDMDGCPINVCPSWVILDTVFNCSAVAVTKTLPSFKPWSFPSWFDIVTSPDTPRSVNFPVLRVVAPIVVLSIEPPEMVMVAIIALLLSSSPYIFDALTWASRNSNVPF